MNRTATPEMSANERLGLHSEFHRKLQPMIGTFQVKQTARFVTDATLLNLITLLHVVIG
ncbi:hypothetical protein [Oculatella sp. FACHB-28]|uniref:hypothetical protein n=1 Tax=Oculatella sp. FACHB-28 TaxID=2692845 RepID=UPI001A7EE678|nr:hypothetical protein [Oculatella sp. FACHB-28]